MVEVSVLYGTIALHFFISYLHGVEWIGMQWFIRHFLSDVVNLVIVGSVGGVWRRLIFCSLEAGVVAVVALGGHGSL